MKILPICQKKEKEKKEYINACSENNSRGYRWVVDVKLESDQRMNNVCDRPTSNIFKAGH